MFSDVDESLRDRLIADMPIQGGEVDIAFDRPTREWASRLSKPTLNLFLFDVRERTEFRDPNPRTILSREGRVTTQRPPLRMDLSYVVTAWTKEASDEHRILARALSAMYRAAQFEQQTLSGRLVDSEHPLLTRVMPPDHLAKPADLWGVLDNDLHASLTWVITAPLDVWVPQTGPVVRTRELRFADGEETFTQIGGAVHLRGNPDARQAGVTLAVLGTALRATTGDDGRFTFEGIPAGSYTLRVESPDRPAEDRPFTVPSPSYDQEI